MALTPTGPRIPAERQGRVAPRPASRPVARPATPAPATPAPATPVPSEPASPRRPDRGFRLRTAVTEEEIERQIARLLNLIANDNIDPDAPAGSYLNLLV